MPLVNWNECNLYFERCKIHYCLLAYRLPVTLDIGDWNVPPPKGLWCMFRFDSWNYSSARASSSVKPLPSTRAFYWAWCKFSWISDYHFCHHEFDPAQVGIPPIRTGSGYDVAAVHFSFKLHWWWYEIKPLSCSINPECCFLI